MIDIKLVKIPSGNFLLGSSKKEVEIQITGNPNTDERLFERQLKEHKVFLEEFYISKYPITNKQFQVFINRTKYKTTAEKEGFGFHFDGEMKKIKGADWKHPHGPDSSISKKHNHPVVMVSWFDSLEFCTWLSKENKSNCALPSEAQWEKAARGPNGNIWPWGNSWNNKLCNCENSINDTSQVGSYSPKGDSYYGCADMAGDVLEWTTTTIGTNDPWPAKFKYPYNPNDGRENLKVKTRRVGRGGTYQRNSDMCRSAFRFADNPYDRYSSMGFRIVCKKKN